MRADGEQLRQEREAFELNRAHAAQWFRVRILLVYLSLLVALGIGGVMTYVILSAPRFPTPVVVAAAVGLCGDLLGACLAVWKLVLGPPTTVPLSAVTQASRSGTIAHS